MTTARCALTIAFGAIFCVRASACMCFGNPMCDSVGRNSTAAFVGRAVEVWPPIEASSGEREPRSLTELRSVILKRWQGQFSAEEESYIRTSRDRDQIWARYWLLRRVRFEVNETLAGPAIHDVYTDWTSCGYRFEVGRVYLVDAEHDGKRYRTGACYRTSQIQSWRAAEDLKALRAWKSGAPLLPRIYGQFVLTDLSGQARARLIAGQKEIAASMEADGSFAFDGLEKTKYLLQVGDARGTGEREIDLSHSRCFEASPWFYGKWEILGGPVVIKPPPAPLIPEPPPIVH